MTTLFETAVIPKLTGKDLEDHCRKRMEWHEDRNHCCMSRYGVQGVFMKNPKTSAMEWRPIASLPDYEGLLPGGRQFTFDAKVTSAASFELRDDKFKQRQFKHLTTRARFGGIAFLLIHFNPRALTRGEIPGSTWAFPVSLEHPLWAAFDRSETKRITISDCEEYAVRIEWNIPQGGRTLRPDLLAAVLKLAG